MAVSLAPPVSLAQPSHFRATRSVLLSSPTPARFLFSPSRSLFLFRPRFHSFPPTAQISLPTLSTPDTRHPIPNYVKRFRILRPDYAASLPSHSLSLSPHCFHPVSFAPTRVLLDCRADLSKRGLPKIMQFASSQVFAFFL
ncbi:hypothetical protein PUN28_009187 [Cardiocondyla obscurior]|uniref:Uncharacterized protein n=1 Tax=Cardiocondyla obscurior TaxID=286306 RepID=A0AAW2FUD4_9HYME